MARILIIENSQFATERLKKVLEQGDHQVVGEAKNAKEGIEQFRKLSPDLVTLDLIMPQSDNTDSLVAIQEIKKINPDAKIVAITGVAQEPILQEILDAGACNYIIKPLNDSETLDKISECLKN